jgi:hypothetical protein
VAANIIDYEPDVVFVHDPQPLALARELKSGREKWIWWCHIAINGYSLRKNPGLWNFITYWTGAFDARNGMKRSFSFLKSPPLALKWGNIVC